MRTTSSPFAASGATRSAKRLPREDIASSIFYPLPLHRQPAYEPSNRGLTLPAAEAAGEKRALASHAIRLLDEQGIERICACVQQSAR